MSFRPGQVRCYDSTSAVPFLLVDDRARASAATEGRAYQQHLLPALDVATGTIPQPTTSATPPTES